MCLRYFTGRVYNSMFLIEKATHTQLQSKNSSKAFAGLKKPNQTPKNHIFNIDENELNLC